MFVTILLSSLYTLHTARVCEHNSMTSKNYLMQLVLTLLVRTEQTQIDLTKIECNFINLIK